MSAAPKLGIVGLGHLGSALLAGLLASGMASSDIIVCDAPDQVERLRATVSTAVTGDVNSAAAFADILFLTVKSQAFEAIAPGIDRELLAGKTVVSFMAGVTFERIYALVGDIQLVRGMPSLAIATRDGVIGYTASPPEVWEIFHSLGYAFEVAPEDIEKVTAFSGCGPGFAAYILDAFAKAGESMGFSRDEALNITSRTFRAAVNRGDFAETVKAVATPGGATEQGVKHMADAGVPGILEEAMRRAYERMR